MGLSLVAMGLLMLQLLILAFSKFGSFESQEALYEAIAGYGLGGSSMALFSRVGGGIFTKAADVGADLSGKIDSGMDEDDPRNPACLADNVGDNVGDIAGMGADLFGSSQKQPAQLSWSQASARMTGTSGRSPCFCLLGVLSRASSRFWFAMLSTLWPRMQMWRRP